MVKLFLCLNSILFFINITLGQEVRLNIQYIKSYFSDTKNILSSPTRWNNNQWWGATTLGISTYGLIHYDLRFQNFIHRNSNSVTSDISNIIEPLGNEIIVLGLSGAGYIAGKILNNNPIQEASLLNAKSVIISGAFVYALKQISHRARPYQVNNPKIWEGPFGNRDFTSFVSGHSAFSFATATTVSSFLIKNKKLKWIPYFIATAISLSRIHDNKHWLSDIFAGATIGISTTKFIIKQHKKSTSNEMLFK